MHQFYFVILKSTLIFNTFVGLSHQLSSASTHSLPSRIDQLTDAEDEDEDSSSAIDPYDDSTPTNTSPEVVLGSGRKYSSWYVLLVKSRQGIYIFFWAEKIRSIDTLAFYSMTPTK